MKMIVCSVFANISVAKLKYLKVTSNINIRFRPMTAVTHSYFIVFPFPFPFPSQQVPINKSIVVLATLRYNLLIRYEAIYSINVKPSLSRTNFFYRFSSAIFYKKKTKC